jgi:hypothetical protein
MPALPFSNSMSLAPNLMDDNLTGGSIFHQGRTACCLVVACLSPSTLTHRWTVRMWLGSFRRSFCSSSSRRTWPGAAGRDRFRSLEGR